MFKRLFELPSRSFFLFGARGTGKSTLLREHLPPHRSDVLWLDLLKPEDERLLSLKPSELRRRIAARPGTKWVVIDEVQKVPELLDIVHSEIESKGPLFALTGSSARKLKRGKANLLAGRAFWRELFPLTHIELREDFALDDVLSWGSLPTVFSLTDEDKAEYLRTYAQVYLREEIQVEQLVRKLVPFRAFLEIAAQSNGKIVSYSKTARDVNSDPVSVQSYYEILEETLIGFSLPAYHTSVRKRVRKNPKFYFFDRGVTRALENALEVKLRPGTFAYGQAFEHFLIAEIHRLNLLLRCDYKLSYLRTKDDAEVDLIIEKPGKELSLIEIKSSDRVLDEDLRSLARFGQDFEKAELLCLSRDENTRRTGRIDCLHWRRGLERLFTGRIPLLALALLTSFTSIQAHADKSRALFSVVTPVTVHEAPEDAVTVDLSGRAKGDSLAALGDRMEVDSSKADLKLRLWKVHDTYNFESSIDITGVNQSVLPTDEQGRVLKEAKSVTDRPFIRYYMPNREPVTIDLTCKKKECRALWVKAPFEPLEFQSFHVEINIRGMRGRSWKAGYNLSFYQNDTVIELPKPDGFPARLSYFHPGSPWPPTKRTTLAREELQISSFEDWTMGAKDSTGYRRIKELSRLLIQKGSVNIDITNGEYLESREIKEGQALWLLPEQIIRVSGATNGTRILRVAFDKK